MKQYSFLVRNTGGLVACCERMQQVLFARPQTKSLLIFVASPARDVQLISAMLRYLAGKFPDAALLAFQTGTSIAADRLSSDATALAFSFFDTTEAHVHVLAQDESGAPTPKALASRLLQTVANHKNPRLLGIFSALVPQDIAPFLEVVSCCPQDLPVFGGMVTGLMLENQLFAKDGTPVPRGVAYLVLSGEDLVVTQEIDLGWHPLGKRFTVTALDGPTTLLELDHRPAMEAYEKYFGIAPDEHFLENARTFPLYFTRQGQELLRYPKGVLKNGGLLFGAPLTLGEELCFAYGDPAAIIGGSSRTRALIAASQPEGVFLTNCCARHELLESDIETEVAACSGLAPTLGFFSYGEFERAGGEILITNMTLIVTILREGAAKKSAKIEEPPPFRLSYRSAVLSHLAHYVDATTRELLDLNEKLNQQATTDDLTGLINRRELEQRLPETLREAKRTGRPLSVLMIDIDDFKNINDRLGHAAGDAALVLVARVLERATRREDLICRWGGDEFFLALPGANAKAALSVGNRIEKFAKAVHQAGGHTLRITLSIGGTEAQKEDAIDTLFHRADGALYRAKAVPGKGQVILER